MNTITVFLASSEELINDHNSFHSLIASLDDIYEPRGIRVKLKRWEDFIAYCTGERTQDDYNKVLVACDISVCMFHCKGGKFTIEEFEKSVESYKLTHSPKPYVYVRALVDGEVEEEALTKFKKKLFEQMGHYWCNYATDDAMKLHFVMQFERLLNEGNPSVSEEHYLKVEHGNVLLHGRKIADYANLPFASENSEMKNLHGKINTLDKEVVELRALNLEVLRPTIDKMLAERNECHKQLEQLEKQLLDIALSISKMISSDKPISERKRLAIEMFEKGNNQGVLEVLNEADIETDYQSARREIVSGKELKAASEAMIESGELKVCSLVDELILKAKTWMNTYSEPNRFEKASKCYEQAIQYTRESLQDKDLAKMLFEYAQFLDDNHCKKYVERYYLEALCLFKTISVTQPNINSDVALTLNNLAGYYVSIKNFEKAEQFYEESLSILQCIDKQLSTLSTKANIAASLNNRGNLYRSQGSFIEAEKTYREALDILRKYQTGFFKIITGYEPVLAATLINLGKVQSDLCYYSEALKSIDEALKIYRDLVKNNSTLYTSLVAQCLSEISNIQRRISNYDSAKSNINEALKIHQLLFERYPQKYAQQLSSDLTILASLYYSTDDLERAENLYKEAMTIVSDFAHILDEPSSVAHIYLGLAKIYRTKGNYASSIEHCKMAIQQLELVSNTHKDINTYERDLAYAMCELANLYYITRENLEEADKLFSDSVIKWRNLSHKNEDVYAAASLAYTLHSYAELYFYMNKIKLSEKLVEESIALYRGLPSRYKDTTAASYANALCFFAILCILKQDLIKAKDLYKEAELIYRNLIDYDINCELDLIKALVGLHFLSDSSAETDEIFKEVLRLWNNSSMEKDNYELAYASIIWKQATQCEESQLMEYEDLLLEALNIYQRHKQCEKSNVLTGDISFVLADILFRLALLCIYTQRHTEAEDYCLRSLSIYEYLVVANSDLYRSSYANGLTITAYCSLLLKKYAQSEEYSRNALKWSDDVYIYTNLAASILLQGRYEEAKQIYLTYKDNLKDSFLEDIQMLKENNAIPSHLNKDVDNIVELLLSDVQ